MVKDPKSNELFSQKWNKSVITAEATFRDACSAITNSGSLIACFVNQFGKLIAILSDSDIRKALLNGAKLEDQALQYARIDPVTAHFKSSKEDLQFLTAETGKREIPLIDKNGSLRDIFVLGIHDSRSTWIAESCGTETHSAIYPAHDYPAFILAGGLGTRLRVKVSDRPKPLALVGGKPIIDRLFNKLIQCGFRKFYVSLNYRADAMIEHIEKFKKGISENIEIMFLVETKKLGTAGPLSQIRDLVTKPILVCNADILTSLAFREVIRVHRSENADITCVVYPYRLTVPYGVAYLERGQIVNVREKPDFSFLVNAGIYVISPKVVHSLTTNECFDMPDLISTWLAKKDARVTPFFMHEYWLDIGTPQDYEKANNDILNISL